MNFARKSVMSAVLAGGLALGAADPARAGTLVDDFVQPPSAARPGVYWYFMDGNQDRGEMAADLEAMARVGLGSVLFLEVDIGIPHGAVPFMSEAWQGSFVHAVKTAERLGMEVMLGTGPGWAGSGGSWVGPEDSMQQLVGGSVQAAGPATFDQVLPLPPPPAPNRFAGMNPEQLAARGAWYRDVAVLAFPTPPAGVAQVEQADLKTLKDVRPFSIRDQMKGGVPPFVQAPAEFGAADPARAFDPAKVIDLTRRMDRDGRLRWEVPPGSWTVMRFVARSTGQTSRPAPRAGHGFENDKFNRDSFRRHWDNFQGRLLSRLGPLTPGRGLTTIHLDSWEMSSQNWTAAFREEFSRRRGYDPLPFYPAFMGQVVGGLERTERFLWDLRTTAQDLMLEQHAGAIRELSHEHGLHYANEPYDMNPAGNLDLGAAADIPACEFWNARGGPDTVYSCIEATSIAHTMGRSRVNAESFTSDAAYAFADSPATMKNQTDWALAMGINGIFFHTFQHQALGGRERPGMTMGPYGVQWNRNETWWELLRGYHEYITRCSALLRQGTAVADVLYLTPEGAPHVFLAPKSALEGSVRLLDKKGYAFDAVSPRILEARARVEDGRIVFPGGTSYRLLVLPDVATMTPEALAKVAELAKAGANVVGNPPRKSPSLVDYPRCDARVAALAREIWGDLPRPAAVTRRPYGRGSIFWGGALAAGDPADSDLYPAYGETARILRGLGVEEDFTSPSQNLRYGHRQTREAEVYFVSNRTDQTLVTEGVFRVSGPSPELWDPMTGERRPLPEFTRENGVTRVPLGFAPAQSFFVVFPRVENAAVARSAVPNFAEMKPSQTLGGSWTVVFDPKWGGPERIEFGELQDWTKRAEPGIRYYSGTAVYRKIFDLHQPRAGGAGRVYVDLGRVHDICRVRLNGRDLGVVWTAPWRVEVTDVVKPAGNQLEIEVVNGWVNRLVGDQQPADKDVRTLTFPAGMLGDKPVKAGRYTFSTYPYFRADSPLMPAGLLGPVTIQTSARD